jgi:hypothetical protein
MAKRKLARKSSRDEMAAGRSGRFRVGRVAFARVSEVEGIVASRDLEADLRRLQRVPPQERIAVLAKKYGKK